MSLNRSESRAIAARYVRAMFDVACEQNKQAIVGDDLLQLKQLVAQTPALQSLITNPMIKPDAKADAFAAVLQAAKADALTVTLVSFLAKQQRVETIADVADIYQQTLIAHKGELSAEVITAKPLSTKQQQAITDRLKKAAGQDVHLTTKQDPAILGGLIIKMGSRMLDRSVAGKLQRLKTSLIRGAA